MNLMKTAVAGVCGFLACAAVTHAETLDVKVPFSFMVGAQQMPAGVYRIERDFGLHGVMLIRGEQGNTAQVFVQPVPLKGTNPAAGAPSLVFVPYETQKRLTAIWESDAIGHEVSTRRDGLRLFGRVDGGGASADVR